MTLKKRQRDESGDGFSCSDSGDSGDASSSSFELEPCNVTLYFQSNGDLEPDQVWLSFVDQVSDIYRPWGAVEKPDLPSIEDSLVKTMEESDREHIRGFTSLKFEGVRVLYGCEDNFLCGAEALQTVDLSPLNDWYVIGDYFLSMCVSLRHLEI
mmetsp:Transcript_37139/g.43367  ORF Transcript_37139/g.43367 Transcript_37139/m.43367 type:complete len:154 (-) Transcript_37139:105-566(-)